MLSLPKTVSRKEVFRSVINSSYAISMSSRIRVHESDTWIVTLTLIPSQTPELWHTHIDSEPDTWIATHPHWFRVRHLIVTHSHWFSSQTPGLWHIDTDSRDRHLDYDTRSLIPSQTPGLWHTDTDSRVRQLNCDTPTLRIPHVRTETFGQRCFSYCVFGSNGFRSLMTSVTFSPPVP